MMQVALSILGFIFSVGITFFGLCLTALYFPWKTEDIMRKESIFSILSMMVTLLAFAGIIASITFFIEGIV